MKSKTYLLFAALPFLTAIEARGDGFYIPVQAPEATGRGNAWLATANTASAVYYNAAGLTQLEAGEVVVGAYAIMLGLEADLDSGAHEEADNDWAFVPQIYAAVPLNDRLVAGFGINTPFGLATHWDENSQFKFLAVDTELKYVTGWAVLGYKLTDTWSVGGGIGIHYADADITKSPNPFVVNDFSEFSGDDAGFSWTLSTRWEPSEHHSFGLVYRSKTEFELEGDAKVPGLGSEHASLDFMTPATAGAGYAYSPCKQWVFEANIEWVNWDQLNSLELSKDSGDGSIPFNWESNFIYSIGATHYFENGLNVSAGYNYIENSQPDDTFNPGISDANRHWLNAGIGGGCGDLKWNVAFQYAFSDRDVSGSQFGLADGTFKSRFYGVMANVNYRF